MASDAAWITLHNVSVQRGGNTVLSNISCTIRDGESWAITGPSASGKTTLAETMLGRHRLSAGEIQWPMLDNQPGKLPCDRIQLVGFKEESRLFHYGGLYYQQRFEFADNDEPLSLEQFLRAGLPVADGDVDAVAAMLGIAEQRPLAFMKLSNGQARRARIARGLLGRPQLLILDEPFIGVDVTGREFIAERLAEVVRMGQRLMLITSGELPAWITHRLALPGRTEAIGPMPSRDFVPSPIDTTLNPTILELNQVTVRHGGQAILDNLSWRVRAGERWAVVGPNGAGKTTLLALACGDHPQAFSNDVRLFGRPRGSGETVWEIKRRIGFVSPEFHLYFSEPLNGFEAAATGFHDVLLYRALTPEQATAVRTVFATWGMTDLLNRPFRQMATGQQRLVLLARAMVKQPELLVLDEPFQGLDPATARKLRDWLDATLTPQQTLILTTHIRDEIPRSVTQELRLNQGRRETNTPSG